MYFFEGLPGVTTRAANDDNAVSDHTLHSRETLRLVHAYYRIADPKQRRTVIQFMRSVRS